jgi:hypothetical protein
MRSFKVVSMCFSLLGITIIPAKADCSVPGHPICFHKCATVCRSYYDPGPPERCPYDCTGFFVKPGDFILNLEGISKEQKESIESILK